MSKSCVDLRFVCLLFGRSFMIIVIRLDIWFI